MCCSLFLLIRSPEPPKTAHSSPHFPFAASTEGLHSPGGVARRHALARGEYESHESGDQTAWVRSASGPFARFA